MRRGVGAVGSAVLITAQVFLGPLAVGEEDGGAGGESGGDQQAGGEIVGDSPEVFARDGGDLGPSGGPRRGGGDVVCRWYHEMLGMRVNVREPPPPELQLLVDDGIPLMFTRVCEDTETGEYVSFEEGIELSLPVGGPAVEPRQLAFMARSRLPLPLPEARTSPEGDQTTQLPTWLWVENWEAPSRSASAGGVSAVVTAEPQSQHWQFGTTGDEVICHGPGASYDTARPASEQTTACSYTYRRSSAGEPEGAFVVTVTLTWAISWSSNQGVGGDLGTVSRTTELPMRVAEHHALNDAGRSSR